MTLDRQAARRFLDLVVHSDKESLSKLERDLAEMMQQALDELEARPSWKDMHDQMETLILKQEMTLDDLREENQKLKDWIDRLEQEQEV